jgi:hypothetical protein
MLFHDQSHRGPTQIVSLPWRQSPSTKLVQQTQACPQTSQLQTSPKTTTGLPSMFYCFPWLDPWLLYVAAIRIFRQTAVLTKWQSLVSYFLPILRRVPLFGLTAANEWLWAFDLSAVYIGYGIIIGPSVSAYIALGAVIGWGILSPVAKHNGWAPGPVDD